MSKPNHVFFTAFLALVGFHATPAASSTTAYLSRTGSGTTCTLALPCNDMQTAITAAQFGEVICLDRYAYSILSPVTITQTINISCGDGLWEAPFGTVTINTPAVAHVIIEGLVVDTLGIGGITMNFTGAGSLRLRRVKLGNAFFSTALNFAPSGPATLTVSDSIFSDNGGSGINVRPTGSGYANVHLRNVKLEGNANGLFVDGSASSIGINVNISASSATENQGNGIGAYTTAGGASVTVSVKDSHISGNLTNGIGVLGATASGAGSAVIEVGSTMITANVNGVVTGGAGQVRTHGNNQLRLNGTNGAFTSNVGLQ
jgi:prepilin-type processing-associated H-X9-DG protein